MLCTLTIKKKHRYITGTHRYFLYNLHDFTVPQRCWGNVKHFESFGPRQLSLPTILSKLPMLKVIKSWSVGSFEGDLLTVNQETLGRKTLLQMEQKKCDWRKWKKEQKESNFKNWEGYASTDYFFIHPKFSPSFKSHQSASDSQRIHFNLKEGSMLVTHSSQRKLVPLWETKKWGERQLASLAYH